MWKRALLGGPVFLLRAAAGHAAGRPARRPPTRAL